MVHLTITQPDDWHLHVREGDALAEILAETTRCFARAIIMPNLKPPVISTEQAVVYQHQILQAIPVGVDFTPLMTLYLTEATTPEEIGRARASKIIQALKYYPAGATTNSDAGVRDIRKTYPVLEALTKHAMPLLIHGEVTDPNCDVFEREEVFIEQTLKPVIQDFPDLKIVFEHITTKQAVEFVLNQPDNIAATITPHHLLYNRNAMFKSGIRPHYYCLPILKHEQHRLALVAAATSGNPKFFLGTDSAPHTVSKKESNCGCAGIYNAPVAIELYAQIFEAAGALDKLEGFASLHGPGFYALPVNKSKLVLEKKSWIVPKEKRLGRDTVIPLCNGEQLHWQIKI